jgi:hypothetical protein
MFRRISSAAILLLLTCAALSAPRPSSPPPNPQPTEVKVISVPPVQPTEVKIISTPPATPTEVKIVATPPDESARALVRWTLGIVVSNAVLCIVTFYMGMRQSGDNERSIGVSAQAAAAANVSAQAADRSANAAGESIAGARRQERAALERELNRVAHKVVGTAKRLVRLASTVPMARTQLHILCGQGGMPAQIKEETDKTLSDRRASMDEMSAYANDITRDSLRTLDDDVLTVKLWRMDEYQVKLEVLREEITDELTRYETESTTRRQQQTLMHAGVLAGRPPPKTTLG